MSFNVLNYNGVLLVWIILKKLQGIIPLNTITYFPRWGDKIGRILWVRFFLIDNHSNDYEHIVLNIELIERDFDRSKINYRIPYWSSKSIRVKPLNQFNKLIPKTKNISARRLSDLRGGSKVAIRYNTMHDEPVFKP